MTKEKCNLNFINSQTTHFSKVKAIENWAGNRVCFEAVYMLVQFQKKQQCAENL